MREKCVGSLNGAATVNSAPRAQPSIKQRMGRTMTSRLDEFFIVTLTQAPLPPTPADAVRGVAAVCGRGAMVNMVCGVLLLFDEELLQ